MLVKLISRLNFLFKFHIVPAIKTLNIAVKTLVILTHLCLFASGQVNKLKKNMFDI